MEIHGPYSGKQTRRRLTFKLHQRNIITNSERRPIELYVLKSQQIRTHFKTKWLFTIPMSVNTQSHY
jgi:hypothetical protein